MTKLEVLKLCEELVPKYGFDPLLILAIAEQESAYDERARRLENGFFNRYTKNLSEFNDIDEVLLAASWGLMQMMGYSLNEVKYFETFGDPVGSPVYEGLLYYLDTPHDQIKTGCQWLAVKRKKANEDVTKMLQYWNGSADYPPQVLKRYKRLREEFKQL